MGAVGLMGSDDLLACFIAGNAFTWNDWFRIKTEKENLIEVCNDKKHTGVSLTYNLSLIQRSSIYCSTLASLFILA